MEIIISVFLGAWIAAAGVVANRWLKREYEPYIHDEINKGLGE